MYSNSNNPLFGDTVTPNNPLFGGTYPNKPLIGATVPPTNLLFQDCPFRFWHSRGLHEEDNTQMKQGIIAS